MHAIEEQKIMTNLTRLITLDQPLLLGSRSGQHLGTGHGDISMRSHPANRKEAITMECMDLVLLHAIAGFYFGEAIQRTANYPQGYTTEGEQRRNEYLH
jgi:hypothetical protein